ncbi:helix-turn-helix domain-containing protein [Pelagibius sp.]|uniref:helix-turn-helix domain-containing protein n=1 Tax=Pelagibius sp. TaxID=1931238 RepID=UPI003B512253
MAEAILSTDSPTLNQSAPDTGGPLTREQCRAARAMLHWSQGDLARRARISAVTVRTFERGQSSLKESTAQLLRLTFVSAGLLFIDADETGGAGVCLARPVP